MAPLRDEIPRDSRKADRMIQPGARQRLKRLPGISVALATYNGEKYLREQLDSLLAQTLQPCELVVGDDGSTDQTLDILQKFKADAPFPVHITQNPNSLGFGDNFLATASRCHGDWIAFCDQDDVWLPRKLSDCWSAIKQNEDSISLILQTAYLADSSLQKQGRIFPREVKKRYFSANKHYGFWVWVGFCQTVKRDLIGDIPWTSRPANYFPGHIVQSHDKWTCMIANSVGGIQYLPEPAALFRRHENALTGSYAGKTVRERLSQAQRTGAEHYFFLSDVAKQSADYMQKLSKLNKKEVIKKKFATTGQRFLHLSNVQRCRAHLYSQDIFFKRFTIYCRLWLTGAYIGHPFNSMGSKSAAKDFLQVISRKNFLGKIKI